MLFISKSARILARHRVEARLSQWDPGSSGDDSNGFEAGSEMKELPMRTAVKTRRAATLERVRELPETMRAAAIDAFGGPGALSIQSLPVPVPAADEVLIATNTSGVGQWGADMREGCSPTGRRPRPTRNVYSIAKRNSTNSPPPVVTSEKSSAPCSCNSPTSIAKSSRACRDSSRVCARS